MVRGPIGREKGVFYEQVRGGRLPDPYIPRKGWSEPTICSVCHAIYRKKRWAFDEALRLKLEKDKETKYIKCPACRKIEERFAMGIVSISGDFVAEHRDDIVNLVKSEERRAMQKNPMERLISVEKKDSGVHVETTTDSLALRIGRVLNRAYKGDVKFNFHYGDKQVEIKWHRDK